MSSQLKLLCNKKDREGRAVAKIDEADERVKGDIKNLASSIPLCVWRKSDLCVNLDLARQNKQACENRESVREESTEWVLHSNL